MFRKIFFLSITVFILGCEKETEGSDAYGNFEATATTISAETGGQLLFLHADEGEVLEPGKRVAIVDTTHLYLQKKQLYASLGTLPKKLRNTDADREVLAEQRVNLVRERDRMSRLLAKEAATSQQLDDLNGRIAVVDQQMVALQSQTSIGNSAILSERSPIFAQIDILDDQLSKSYIDNPIRGTVLTRIAEAHEMVGPGSPLYRIAPLDTLTLRFYVDAVQLQEVRLGQTVQVLIDSGKEGTREVPGRISWISGQAEFTPKTIQTKTDRVNLVYAVKATVANEDGLLKIGMPAEINFVHRTLTQPGEE